MALLCEIRKQDRIVSGEVVKVGSVVLLPDDLALKLEDKGLVRWANPKAHKDLAKKRSEARKRNAALALEMKGRG